MPPLGFNRLTYGTVILHSDSHYYYKCGHLPLRATATDLYSYWNQYQISAALTYWHVSEQAYQYAEDKNSFVALLAHIMFLLLLNSSVVLNVKGFLQGLKNNDNITWSFNSKIDLNYIIPDTSEWWFFRYFWLLSSPPTSISPLEIKFWISKYVVLIIKGD